MLLYILKTERTAETIFYQVTMEHTLCYPDLHLDTDVFQQLQQHLHTKGSITPTACMDIGCPQTALTPANEDAITEAVE
jgi:hypothetical protein